MLLEDSTIHTFDGSIRISEESMVRDESIFPGIDGISTPETFHAANLTDGLTFLLLELQAPEQVRHLLIALQGLLAGRSTVVNFRRSELAVRLFKIDNQWIDKENLERLKNRVTSHTSMMQDWIYKEGLQNIIDYQPGTKTTDSRIRTQIFKWSVAIAKAAGRRLHPDSGDLERRKIFIEEARRLVVKRLARSKKTTSSRMKREHSESAEWQMFMTYAAKIFKRQLRKSKDGKNGASSFIFSELQRKFDLVCLENLRGEIEQDGFDETTKKGTCSLENSRVDQIEGTQGGDSPVTATAVADDDYLAIDAPPCVPSLPDHAIIELSDSARGLVQCTAGRSGDHWRSIHAAASVGAVPVGIVRKDGQLDKPHPEQVADMVSFLKGFDGQVKRSIDARESLVLRLSDCVFQRDDCNAADAAKLSPFAWMVAETSPGSFHCWFRLAAGQSRADFHAALTAAGIGGNAGGTHSGRWPGTLNGKPTRDGWIVRLVSATPGRVASLEQVNAAFPGAVVADSNPLQKRHPKKPFSSRSERVRFPDYGRCLADHPHHSEQRPDRSAADASFIRLAADYRFTPDEIFNELRRVSERFGALPERKARIEIDRIWSKFVAA